MSQTTTKTTSALMATSAMRDLTLPLEAVNALSITGAMQVLRLFVLQANTQKTQDQLQQPNASTVLPENIVPTTPKAS
jgi:hypothetical protein